MKEFSWSRNGAFLGQKKRPRRTSLGVEGCGKGRENRVGTARGEQLVVSMLRGGCQFATV